jgi:nitrogen fixation/metabolism regulation signal transduction histidine kinase
MKNHKIKMYLIATILALSVSSLLGSYLLIDEILDSSISLGINQKNEKILSEYQKDLRALRQLNPNNQKSYKDKFLMVQDARLFYQKPAETISAIKRTYLDYFLILFAGILLVSIFAAILLSRKVSQSYTRLVNSDLEKSRRLSELEHFEVWQNIASTLAHEIKNPLTPIELMVSHLPVVSESDNDEILQAKISKVQEVVLQEVTRLKEMVSHFSEFSKLPEPTLKKIEFVRFLHGCKEHFSASWKQLDISISFEQLPTEIFINLDIQLFKQCLLNLTQNSIQANPEKTEIPIKWHLTNVQDNRLQVSIWNGGKQISEKISKEIFQMGFSTKSIQTNQGLGLSVVRKIILEHYGEIECVECQSGAMFMISLPIVKNRESSRR